MKRLIILIAFIVLFASCEEPTEEFNLVGKTYAAHFSTDTITGMQYLTCYKFISSTYAKQFWVEKEGGTYTYHGGGWEDSCTYVFDYPKLTIYRHRDDLYSYGANNVFNCQFKNHETFYEYHDWMGAEGIQRDSIMEYKHLIYFDF